MEAMVTVLTAILLLVAVSFFGFIKWRFRYWKNKGVYARTPTFPVGHCKNMILQKTSMGVEFWHEYNHLKEKSLPFGGYYFLTKPIFVPVDLDLVKKILITDFEHFTDHTLFTEEYDELSLNLFSMKGSAWKKMRAKLSSAFTPSKNRMLFETVLKCVDELAELLEGVAARNERVNVKELTSRLSMDVVSSCIFGFDSNSLSDPNSKIQKVLDKVFGPSLRNAVVWALALLAPGFFSFFKLKLYSDDVTNLFLDLVKQTISYRETNPVVRPDFTQLLLQVKSDEGLRDKSVMGVGEMSAHFIAFFAAGYESSSGTTLNCLYELARNTELQAKLREEIRSCFAGRKITYDLVQNLPLLEKVVNGEVIRSTSSDVIHFLETFRMYPPLPTLTRECTKDYPIPNSEVVIDKGCFVLVPILGIQRDPEVYPDPDVFDPERFSPERSKGRHTSAWAPFGLGPRTCVAYQFGLMVIKTTLAILLSKYQFSLHSDVRYPLEMSSKTFILFPKETIYLNVQRI